MVSITACTAAINIYIAVEFIEEPQNQSILIGESATFYCKAYAHTVTWYINNQELEYPHDWNQPPQDIHLGKRLISHDTYNLSMTISGTLFRNNTIIKCIATGDTFPTAKARSGTVTLQIYREPI